MYCQIYSCLTIFCALIIIQFLFEVIYVWKIEDCITNIMFSAVLKELTNLIIIRNCSSVEAPGSPTTERSKFSHIQFHMIKYEDLSCVSWSPCCANQASWYLWWLSVQNFFYLFSSFSIYSFSRESRAGALLKNIRLSQHNRHFLLASFGREVVHTSSSELIFIWNSCWLFFFEL